MSKAMSKLTIFVQECRDEPARYQPGSFREHLDALGTVLLRHLDDEVASLKGSRLRESGMTLAALRQLPM